MGDVVIGVDACVTAEGWRRRVARLGRGFDALARVAILVVEAIAKFLGPAGAAVFVGDTTLVTPRGGLSFGHTTPLAKGAWRRRGAGRWELVGYAELIDAALVGAAPLKPFARAPTTAPFALPGAWGADLRAVGDAGPQRLGLALIAAHIFATYGLFGDGAIAVLAALDAAFAACADLALGAVLISAAVALVEDALAGGAGLGLAVGVIEAVDASAAFALASQAAVGAVFAARDIDTDLASAAQATKQRSHQPQQEPTSHSAPPWPRGMGLLPSTGRRQHNARQDRLHNANKELKTSPL